MSKKIDQHSSLSHIWKSKGQLRQLLKYDIFYYDSETEKPVLCVLHGYPTSSFDYHKALPILEQQYRVIVHDHLGFGFSDKPENYSYSLIEQTDVALSLWKYLGLKKIHVLGHDYGTSVVTELVARDILGQLHSFEIETVTLCNGSMHVELAQLRWIQKLLLNKISGPLIARLSTKNTMVKNIKALFVDDSLISEQELNAIWNMMTFNDGRKVLHQVTQYISERYKFWHRWIGALQQTHLPVNIVWAKNDKVAIEKMAHVLNSEIKLSTLNVLPDLGHFPMIESPEIWSNAVLEGIMELSQ